MIGLGKSAKYKDSISGFEGVATARAIYLYSHAQVCLESTKLNENGLPQEVWFAEERLIPMDEESKSKKSTPPPPPSPPDNQFLKEGDVE